MADDPSGSAARRRRGQPARGKRRLLPLLTGFALAALVGGVAGGLIVEAWSSGGDGGSGAAGPDGAAAACRASSVADDALPSVVTVRASRGQEGSSGSGVAVRSGGFILTNDHVIGVAVGGGTI